jgi:exopolyphosphatase/guanosine-5'-triphosphate,3'-diphosphate pyrophosphatase
VVDPRTVRTAGRRDVRVAAIDCGTNSLRLLVADVGPGGDVVTVERRTTIVRLGQGVDRTGRLAPDALARTFAVCAEYAHVIAGAGAERVRFIATSATRDAANRQVFLDGVQDRLGVVAEVVTGDVEARLSFAGATLGLADVPVARAPYLVLDIGGGSTEFVLGGDGHTAPVDTVVAATSVDIGSVRLAERRLVDDPPTAVQVAAAVADIDEAIAKAGADVDLGRAGCVVGVAGSVTTVAAGVLGLTRDDRSRVHHAAIAFSDLHATGHRLREMPRDERAALPYLTPGRVDVIGAGALVLERVLTALPQLDTLIVAETDILDGIAAALAR